MINDINLIPKSSKNSSKEAVFMLTAVYLCLAIVVVFLGYFIPLQQRNQIKSDITQKGNKLQEYSDTEETYISLTDTISGMQNKVTYFEALKSRLKMSQVFDDLEENIPSDINLVNISLSEGTLTLTGVSPSYKEAAQYMVKLRGLEYVNGVSFSSAVLEDDEENSNELYDFIINVNLNIPEIVLEPQDESAEDTNQDTTDDSGQDSNNEGEALENEAN